MKKEKKLNDTDISGSEESPSVNGKAREEEKSRREKGRE